MNKIKGVLLLGAVFLLGVGVKHAYAFIANPVQGVGTAGAPAGGVMTVTGTPNPVAALETPAAASPVACTAANVAVLSANTRSQAAFQNLGTVDLCLCYHATTCPAPGATGCGATGVALKAASGAGKGDGGPWNIGNNAGKVWSGGVSCGGSAGGLLAAVAY